MKQTSEEVKALGSAKHRKKGCTLGDFFSLQATGTTKPEELITDNYSPRLQSQKSKSPSPKKKSPSPKKKSPSPKKKKPSPPKRKKSPYPKDDNNNDDPAYEDVLELKKQIE